MISRVVDHGPSDLDNVTFKWIQEVRSSIRNDNANEDIFNADKAVIF